MLHVIGGIVVVLLVLAFIGWLISPRPDEEVIDQLAGQIADHILAEQRRAQAYAVGERLAAEASRALQMVDRQAQAALGQLERQYPPGTQGPPDHRATIEESGPGYARTKSN